MTKEHTPTPWDKLNGVFTPEDGYFSMIQTPDKCIANVFEEANAAHIVKCVNMHDELVEALKEAGDVIESYHKSTGIDLGDASNMPFYKDTMNTIDETLKKAGAL
jgi:N-dimethylarginine dimethylaminohydrolase